MKKSLIFTVALVFILVIAGTAAAAVPGPGPFSDVPAKHWSYDAVTKLAQAGIITGDQGKFMGDSVMTRYEMAQIVARAMEHSDKADANSKALIDKLSEEYTEELKNLGVRVSTLETKVDKTQISGDFNIRYINVNDKINKGTDKDNFFRTRVRINLQHEVADNTSFYARFATRNTFDSTLMANSTNSNHQSLDQYGIKYSFKDWKVNIGRQGVYLGQGLLLSTGDDAQWDNKFDGLVANTKVGSVDVTGIIGKTTGDSPVLNIVGDDPTSWYALDLKGKASNVVSLGASFARAKDDGASGINYWAVNTTVKATSNLTLTGEYAKSSAVDRNKAYVVGGTLGMGKDSFTAQYMNIEGNANNYNNSVYSRAGLAFWGNGTWLNNGGNTDLKGWLLVYYHPLSKNTSLMILNENLKNPAYSGRNNESTIEISTRF